MNYTITYTIETDGDPSSILEGAIAAAEYLHDSIEATGMGLTLDIDEITVADVVGDQ